MPPPGPASASASSRSEVLASLRAAVAEMERAAADGLEDRIEADLDFHRTLCRLTGNETLLHSWQSLEGSIRMSIMFAGVERAVRNMSVQRHREIVDAIATGDAARVSEVITEHMDSAASVLVG